MAVYTNPGSSGVVTQLPFMTAVNPSSGKVGVGADAATAFQNLGISISNSSTSPTESRDTLVHQIATLVTSQGYTLVNATSVNPTIWRNIGSVSFSTAGANQTIDQVSSLLQDYE